jgi:hypothetical protein
VCRNVRSLRGAIAVDDCANAPHADRAPDPTGWPEDEMREARVFLRSLICAPLLSALAACSSSPSKPASSVAGNVHFTMNVSLAPGSEIFRCQFVNMPVGEAFVVAAAHHYTPGSHHLLLYRTDLATIPQGGDQVQDCYEGLGGSIMSHVRGTLYGSQVPDASFTMPAGVAYHVNSQEVLLLQAHYLNASGNQVQASIDVGLTTITDASKVTYRAGNLFYYDPFIDVPPNGTAKAGARCTLTNDLTLVNVFPHFHARGIGYQAYLDLPGQAPASVPFYVSTDWEHPVAFTGQPMKLSAGTAVRFYCDYQNSGTNEYFQGPSAANNEMCMFTGLYYPEVDSNFELCRGSFDQFGVGNQTCGQSSACVQQCPVAGNNPQQGIVSDCWQKCIVSSCPTASQPLFAQLRCIGSKCPTCATGGSDCQQCALTNCSTEINACLSHTCN